MVSPEKKADNVNAFETLIKVAAVGGPVRPLDRFYELGPIRPKGGCWYFSYECPECRRMSPLFHDYSDGNLGNPFKKFGFIVDCQFCAAKAIAASESVKPVQWPLEPGQEPPESEFANRPPRVYQEDPEQRPVIGPLHHYTSLGTLRSIVESKAFWATNVHFLSDSSESEFGLALMRRVAAEARTSAKSIDADFLDYFLEWIDNRGGDEASVYVLCFSEAHDHLGQWRGYTPYGQSVCISISSMLLVKRMQAYGWTCQQCRYNRISQLTWAESILSRLRTRAATGRDAIRANKTQHFHSVLQANLSDLLQVAATLKDESFAEEREVRFISPMINADDPRVGYRQGKTMRIPYVRFPLASDDEQLEIHEIMLGLGSTEPSMMAHVQEVLRQNRVKPPCILSATRIPYREV